MTICKFKVVVAGGRDFNNFPLLRDTLDKLLEVKTHSHLIEIVNGTARGADTLGGCYARLRNYSVALFPADWEQFDKAAGHIRNKEMLDYADVVVVFWDGKSRGTKNMIEITKKAKKPIRVIRY